MKLSQPAIAYALAKPPGTLVAAVGPSGELHAIGLRLGGQQIVSPGQPTAETLHFLRGLTDIGGSAGTAVEVNSKLGELFASVPKAEAYGHLDQGADVIAFIGQGLTVAEAVQKGEVRNAALQTLKFGADAMNALARSGAIHMGPVLGAVVTIISLTGTLVTAFNDQDPSTGQG